MGTKRNPGKYDCYSHLHPDEPHFVIMGRDPAARATIEAWLDERKRLGQDDSIEKQDEAMECLEAMENWGDARAWLKENPSFLIDPRCLQTGTRTNQLYWHHSYDTTAGFYCAETLIDPPDFECLSFSKEGLTKLPTLRQIAESLDLKILENDP